MNKNGCLLLASIFILIVAACFCCFSVFAITASTSGLSEETYQEKIVESGNLNEKIGIISLDGVISAAEDAPFTNGNINMVDNIIGKLKKVQSDSSYRAVIFTVNTPGGSVYDSDRIAKEIEKTREKGIKVVALMEESATSGGYYVSAPADKIVASDVTVTGSIGVVTQVVKLDGLYDKLGIKVINITNTQGNVKTFEKLDDPNSEDSKILKQVLDDDFDSFVNMIATHRPMTKEQILKIADGSIFSGKKAKELGLVDELGDIDKAIEIAETEAGISNAQIVEIKSTDELIGSIFGPGVLKDLKIFGSLEDKVSVRPGVYSYYIAN